MAKPKFEIFKDSQNDWRWRLKSGNGEIVCASEGYESKQGAMKGIKAVKRIAEKAEVKEEKFPTDNTSLD